MGLNEVYSKSSNVGTIILTVLIVCEFIKQIKNDDILKFWENKMFYINTAVVLCHIGSYPYNVYGKLLYYKYPQIWDIYNAYFYIASYIMYLLFAASFIWGKKES
ncbi:hypothetical protein [Dokdonia sp.]|uniref:hypothetical protein n=1 Tax=Dokdonia sp. TaxID=2024995 RepID=UPI00326384CD